MGSRGNFHKRGILWAEHQKHLYPSWFACYLLFQRRKEGRKKNGKENAYALYYIIKVLSAECQVLNMCKTATSFV